MYEDRLKTYLTPNIALVNSQNDLRISNNMSMDKQDDDTSKTLSINNVPLVELVVYHHAKPVPQATTPQVHLQIPFSQ